MVVARRLYTRAQTRLVTERSADRPVMNIVFVARRYWPAVGGVETLLRQVAHGLAERHTVKVIAHTVEDVQSDGLTDSLRPPPSFRPFQDGPVRVEPLVVPAHLRLLMAPLLIQVAPGPRRYAYGPLRVPMSELYARVVGPVIAKRAAGAALIQMWGSDFVAAAAVRAAQLLGIPSVVFPTAHAGQWGDDPGSARTYRAANRVIATLEADASLYQSLGVPREKIAISGACSAPLPAGRGNAIRDSFDIRGPLVVFLGVRRPYKGYDILLDAAPLVASHIPDVTFAFVGPGPPLPIQHGDVRILDVGPTSDLDRAGWLEAADLLALPSRGETFGIAVIEAWSLGTPVIVSDIPALAELVTNSGGGMTAPRDSSAFGRTVTDLLSDKQRLSRMGASGKAHWATNYTIRAVAEKHEQIYQELVTGM
jgi:glycosyltransferase involved in cell wall biosynthesis